VALDNQLLASINLTKDLPDAVSLNSSMDDAGFAALDTESVWLADIKPSMYNHVFDFNGFVYSTKAAIIDVKKSVGRLTGVVAQTPVSGKVKKMITYSLK
jgi:hypothetical protein